MELDFHRENVRLRVSTHRVVGNYSSLSPGFHFSLSVERERERERESWGS